MAPTGYTPLADVLRELAAVVQALAELNDDPPEDASVDEYAAAARRLPTLRARAEVAGQRLGAAWARLSVGSLPVAERERIAAAFREAHAAALARVPPVPTSRRCRRPGGGAGAHVGGPAPAAP